MALCGFYCVIASDKSGIVSGLDFLRLYGPHWRLFSTVETASTRTRSALSDFGWNARQLDGWDGWTASADVIVHRHSS